MDVLGQGREHHVVIEAPETVGDVPLDEPGRPGPVVGHLGQRRVAPPAGTEPVGTRGEPRLVVGLQQQANHFTDELVRPRRQAQRPQLRPLLLGDVDAPRGQEPVALVAHRINDATDLAHRHAVSGFPVGPGRHGAVVGVDTSVGHQVQARVEQLSIQLGTRQTTFAALTQDIQYRFGVLHYAYLPDW